MEDWFEKIAGMKAPAEEGFANGKEIARAFVEWTESFPDTPPLSDEAISRASMYPDRW